MRNHIGLIIFFIICISAIIYSANRTEDSLQKEFEERYNKHRIENFEEVWYLGYISAQRNLSQIPAAQQNIHELYSIGSAMVFNKLTYE